MHVILLPLHPSWLLHQGVVFLVYKNAVQAWLPIIMDGMAARGDPPHLPNPPMPPPTEHLLTVPTLGLEDAEEHFGPNLRKLLQMQISPKLA